MLVDDFKKLISSDEKAIEVLEASYNPTKNILSLRLKADTSNEQAENEIKQFFISNFGIDEIVVEWEENICHDFSESYIKSLESYVSKNFPNINSSFKMEYDEANNILKLIVSNMIEENYLVRENVFEKIKLKVLGDCSKDISIQICVENDICIDEYMSEVKEIEKNMSEEKLKTNPVNLKAETSKAPSIDKDFSIGKKIKDEPIPIENLSDETFWATIQGKVFGIEEKEIKNNKFIVSFYIYDKSSATSCKAFWSKELYERFKENVNEEDMLIISGRYQMDSYLRSYVLTIDSLAKAEDIEELDTAQEKRVELRVHSQMSDLEGFVKIKDLYKKLAKWGHEAVAITDIDVVQSFPEAMSMSEKTGIKTIYGLDANLVIDELPIVSNYKESNSYVVFDIETTGLANQLDKITEIGAVKIKDNEIVDTFSALVNPEKYISEKIVELTGITNEMVANERKIDEVLREFLDFSKDSCLVAHNAEFDISNLRTNAKKLGMEFDFPYIDTLYLARFLLPDLRNHRLNTLAKHFKVSLVNHHRALDDAMATGKVFLELIRELEILGHSLDDKLNKAETSWPKTATRNFNSLILVKNELGRKNLYKIVSESHTNSLYKSPKIPISFLQDHRDGLLIGSGNINGPLYQAIFQSEPEEKINKIAQQYDFLEVQSPRAYEFLVQNSDQRTGIENLKFMEDLTSYIVELGEKNNIPVVATGDVYYLNKNEHIYREIIKSVKYNRIIKESENQYLKTTKEMLEDFAFLGEEKAYEIVVKNTNLISNLVENVRPIPKGKFSPHVEGAEEELREITYKRAREVYGQDLPEIVKDRIEVELNSIISNGYAALYMIARKLVLKSNEDGYVVGSRGSVGSSLVAHLTGITEVNPLAAHYICPNCKHAEFFVKENYDTGFDLKNKDCPICHTAYKKNGNNIPFEVFLGFEGNKEPDIDLNFAGEYQASVHQYTEELFGKDYVYRAGTIGTIAENTAYGYIRKYFDILDQNVNPAEVAYLQKGIVGTKRTTGQHPGGIMIVPHENEIEDFTPINHPANDMDTDIRTTHFAYSAIEETILKLDLLGHDVPSIIKRLEELTGVVPEEVDLSDEKTMSIFSSTDALNFKEEIDGLNVGSLGIPEFGTNFVRQMLKETKPKSMGELFRISGLSHGTDVWLTNAQELVRSGQAVLRDVICTRDDIMTFLIQKGVESNEAFKIMESVRKGRGLTSEQIHLMNSYDLPSWYIDSCLKIKYMFPKAHATAYVLMSFRIAYFKVYYPAAFYATYFTTKLQDFPGSIAFAGLDAVRTEMKRIRSLGFDASNKEQSTYTVLELVEEMLARGYEFEKPSLNRCQGNSFSVSEEGKVIAPYCAIEEVSQQQSKDIYDACKDGDFISIEDFTKRTKVNKTALEGLKREGLLDHLQDTNQIDFFDMF